MTHRAHQVLASNEKMRELAARELGVWTAMGDARRDHAAAVGRSG